MDELDDFSALYRRYSSDVYRYAFWLCGHEADSKDIVAETFTRAFAGADELRSSTVKSYLLTIARNLVLERRRRRRRRPEEALSPELADPGPDPERAAHDSAEARRLLRAMSQLSSADREALLLAGIEGLAQSEIADVLGTTTAAVKVRIFRARLRLTEILEKTQ